MSNKLISRCPVCDNNLRIRKLKCSNCQTEINGKFRLDKFSNLTENQLKFVEVFIKCRGNIKEVEREMGISYPTVRNKLDEIITGLGYNLKTSPEDSTAEKRKEILNMLEKGEINPEQAVKMIRSI